jgi:hypothetical protein
VRAIDADPKASAATVLQSPGLGQHWCARCLDHRRRRTRI